MSRLDEEREMMVGRVEGVVEVGEAVVVFADEIDGDIGEDEVVRLPSSRRSYGGFSSRPLLYE